MWLDVTYEKVEEAGASVSQAMVIAVGVPETGEKCILVVALEAREAEASWLQFCRPLLASRPDASGLVAWHDSPLATRGRAFEQGCRGNHLG